MSNLVERRPREASIIKKCGSSLGSAGDETSATEAKISCQPLLRKVPRKMRKKISLYEFWIEMPLLSTVLPLSPFSSQKTLPVLCLAYWVRFCALSATYRYVFFILPVRHGQKSLWNPARRYYFILYSISCCALVG